LNQKTQAELTGGGLRRSRAFCATDNDVTDFDERVLGSGEFVSELRERGLLDNTPAPALPMSALQRCIEQRYQLDTGALQQRGRMNAVSEARCLFCFCAARLLRYSGAEIARYLKVGPPSVSRAVRKGERIVKADHALECWLYQALRQ
jgi:CRP-like cAMP-binding protein